MKKSWQQGELPNRSALDSPEALAAVAELFPDRDPEDVISEFRQLADEHHRRIRLLFQ